MGRLARDFTQHAKRHNQFGDSLTVMFADTRRGMDAATAQAFDRIKQRAATNPRVAEYVERIEASLTSRAPQISAAACHM